MAAGIKSVVSTNFSGAQIPLLSIESYDELAYGGMIAGINLWDPNLYPGQNGSFSSVVNSVPGRGANSFSAPGAGSLTFAGGGMDFNATIGGLAGLKIGVSATALVPHVNDLTNFEATFTASIAGNVMTVTAMGGGTITQNMNLSGTGVPSGLQVVKQLTGTSGGVGTYRVSASQAVASTTIIGKEEFLVVVLFKATAALGGNSGVMAAQSDSGAVTNTGKLQWCLAVNNGGVQAYVNGVQFASGFNPVVGKIYAVGMHFVQDVTNKQTRVTLYVYNITDQAVVYDGVLFQLVYAAPTTLVNGGTEMGMPYNMTGFISPQNVRVYGLVSFERISYAGSDPAERFGMQVKRAVALAEAGTIS